MALGALAAGMLLASPVASHQAAAEDLPSIANLAERLLPAVVEISVTQEADGGDGDMENFPMPDLGPNSPFR
jgi:S1-C subfamily serine protease